MSSNNCISINNISKSFSGKVVLDSLSCDFIKNQTHVILGKSGTGKSVLLKILIGLIEADSGEVLIDSEDSQSDKEEPTLKMSYVFQTAALLNSLNVLDNVTIFLDEHDIGEKEDRILKASQILNELGVQDTADKMPSELSGGMRKRVAIARSLIINPDILLYDEPTAELDPINTKIISRTIKQLKMEKDITQIVVTHDIDFAFSIADKISILDDGKFVTTGDVDTIKQSNNEILEPF